MFREAWARQLVSGKVRLACYAQWFKPSRCSDTSRMTEKPAIAGPGAHLTDVAMMKECQ